MSGLTFICDHCESVHADMESYRRHVCADVWRDRALAGERLAKEVHEALGWPCPERECGCCQCGAVGRFARLVHVGVGGRRRCRGWRHRWGDGGSSGEWLRSRAGACGGAQVACRRACSCGVSIGDNGAWLPDGTVRETWRAK